jgi:hypothetical protein
MQDSKKQSRFVVILASLCSVVFCVAFVSFTAVPAIFAYSMTSGPQEQIIYGVGRPTLLYVFSPKCHWCELNRPGIEALARSNAGRYRMIGLS